MNYQQILYTQLNISIFFTAVLVYYSTFPVGYNLVGRRFLGLMLFRDAKRSSVKYFLE
jgi:hypothetical protein